MINRRRFFAVSLPTLLGRASLHAMADNMPTLKPESQKPNPRRVKIEVFLLSAALKLGNTNAHIITVVTDEDVPTYASFLQMYTFEEKGDTSKSQAFGPYLRVTPHIEADGKITLDAKVQFEESTAETAPPEQPLSLNSQSLAVKRTVESGHMVTLGGLAMGNEQKQMQLTATLLPPGQMI